MSLKSSFVSYLNQKYPDLSHEQLNPLVSDQLLSPFQITLSKTQIEQLKAEVNAYWNLRNWGESHLNERYKTLNLRRPDNYSVCMSYDFHINPEGKLELIEVNTNASFLALGIELYSFLNLKNPMGSFAEKGLVQMFLNELNLLGAKENSVAIIDENPELQKLYLEFLVFKNLFNKNKIKCEIFNIDKVNDFKNFALVYNRYTDFYLQEEKSFKIKNLYNENKLQLSPQPYDYFLLADKQRLLDWNQQTEIAKPESLLKVHDLGKADRDQMWNERKHLFFKPKTSFGGKQAYKGASISRKVFEEVFNENFIAQQLSVPSQVEVELNGEKMQFKYDLRCYAYKNESQLIIARLYQGQTTNLKTTGGGFACVIVQ